MHTQVFTEHPLLPFYPPEETLEAGLEPNGSALPPTEGPPGPRNQPNTALLSLILMLGTFLIAFFLRKFRNSRFLGGKVHGSRVWCPPQGSLNARLYSRHRLHPSPLPSQSMDSHQLWASWHPIRSLILKKCFTVPQRSFIKMMMPSWVQLAPTGETQRDRFGNFWLLEGDGRGGKPESADPHSTSASCRLAASLGILVSPSPSW